jgi:hypothetical protein
VFALPPRVLPMRRARHRARTVVAFARLPGSILAAMVLLAVMGNGGHPVCLVQVLAGVMVASALLPFVMKDR